MGANTHDSDAHATGVSRALIGTHQTQMPVKRSAGKDQPSSRAENQNDENRRVDRGAQSPRRHPLGRDATRSRQYHQIDARERQVAAERDDDGLHTHIDDDECHQQLVRHANKNSVQEERDWRLQCTSAVEHNQRYVYKSHKWPDRQIDRAAPSNRQSHQGVGRQR